MPLQTKTKTKTDDGGFDVTAVIGRVVPSTTGSKSPFHAAMELIADHAVNMTDGQSVDYRFSGVTVGVAMDAAPGDPYADR